jgi:HK97 family phage major capsid protein
MSANVDDVRAKRDAALARAETIREKVTNDDREFSDDELKQLEQIASEVERHGKVIAALDKLTPTKTAPKSGSDPINPGNRAPVQPRIPTDIKTHGFNSFGEFAIYCRRAGAGESEALNRLLNVATTYGSEAAGADGGFAVPPDFRAQIWKKVMGEDSLLSRATPFVTGANSITFPKDETTPWQTSGGVLVYWENEAGQVSQSKPNLQLETCRLNKLMALVPVSEELLEDAPGIESYLQVKAPEKMTAKLNTSIIRGTGVGQPRGILNSPSLISVAAEASQDINTIVYKNIVNMWSRMYAPCRSNAVWLINQDIEPQLFNLAFREDATSPVPAYMPANGLSASPYATLMGRPVVPVEACSTLGTTGDIIFADLAQYMGLTKGQQIRTDVSMHLYFDQALMAFRFIFRVHGQPLWGSAITPENGSNTRSWAVALDTRP